MGQTRGRTMPGVAWMLSIIAILLISSGCRSSGAASNGTLQASGAIEAEQIRLAPEIGGKVASLLVEEGARVEQDQVLARLDAALLEAQRDQARSAIEGAQGQVDAAQAQLAKARAGARPEEVASARGALAAAEAGLKLAAAQRDAAAAQHLAAQANVAGAQGQFKAAQAGQAGATAGLGAADASLARAKNGATVEEQTIAERSVELAKNALWGAQAQRDAVCGQVGRGATQAGCEGAKAAVQQAEEQVRIAEAQLAQVNEGARKEDIAALQAGVQQAKAGVSAAAADANKAQAAIDAAGAAVALAAANLSGAEASLQAAQAQRDQAQAALDLILAGARREDIQLLEAQVRQAQSALAGAEATLRGLQTQIERMTLRSPVSGIVMVRAGHVGELVASGVPLFTLADLAKVTLTLYIPQADLGRMALGQEVRVTVDAYQDTFVGQVTHIASQAEFTPKNVETREERVNMVFAVEITLDNADGRLLPGMPADAVFVSR
jgi:HlyD family secretion protein